MATISAGVTDILSSGTLYNTSINSGGDLSIEAHGSAYNTTVKFGGVEKVFFLGLAQGTYLSGGTEYVSSGGESLNTTIDKVGDLYVVNGGFASGTTIIQGGLYVSSGGTAAATNVRSGYEFILNGAEAINTHVSSGIVSVFAGGVAQGTVLSSGGVEYVAGNDSGSIIYNGGSQTVRGGGVASGTTISNGGVQTVADGIASGNTISNGGVQIVASGIASGTVIDSGGVQVFNAVNGVQTGNAVDTVLNVGGAIDARYTGYNSSQDTAHIDWTTDLLTLQSNGTVYFSEQLSGNYVGEYAHLASDVNYVGALITLDTTPCYLRGTLILTDQGEAAVESLAIGDKLMTLAGEAAPIRWIGRRRFTGGCAVGNRDIQPVRVKAGAIADHVPARDLWVSPEHAMYLDGVLIPARHLVNGVSIVQESTLEDVEYFHLELERHDVIFAEGAASETFLDDNSRGMFHNVFDYYRLYPDAPRCVEPSYCAPRVEDGHELEAVRRRLNGRAGRLTPNGTARPARVLDGNLERVTRTLIEGWAFEPEGPDTRLRLAILANDAVIGEVVADRYRPDLAAAGIGDGGHSFAFHLPLGFAADRAHQVEVRRTDDWALLPGAPATLAVAPATAAARA
jgi:autotransporter passenger strand-loop-strand repeat protein